MKWFAVEFIPTSCIYFSRHNLKIIRPEQFIIPLLFKVRNIFQINFKIMFDERLFCRSETIKNSKKPYFIIIIIILKNNLSNNSNVLCRIHLDLFLFEYDLLIIHQSLVAAFAQKPTYKSTIIRTGVIFFYLFEYGIS